MSYKSPEQIYLRALNVVLGSFLFGYSISYINVSINTIDCVFEIPIDKIPLYTGIIQCKRYLTHIRSPIASWCLYRSCLQFNCSGLLQSETQPHGCGSYSFSRYVPLAIRERLRIICGSLHLWDRSWNEYHDCPNVHQGVYSSNDAWVGWILQLNKPKRWWIRSFHDCLVIHIYKTNQGIPSRFGTTYNFSLPIRQPQPEFFLEICLRTSLHHHPYSNYRSVLHL